jgi:flagellar hook-basal body complex protein FliE
MTLPALPAVGGISLSAATPAPGATSTSALQAAGNLQVSGASGAESLPGGEALGGVAGEPSATTGTQALRGPASSEATGGEGLGAGNGSSGNFGSALTEAISSLEGSQRSGDSAAQALATGTVKDPESAVVTVEDAALSMQLAAQLRSKATEAVQTIFQTQV